MSKDTVAVSRFIEMLDRVGGEVQRKYVQTRMRRRSVMMTSYVSLEHVHLTGHRTLLRAALQISSVEIQFGTSCGSKNLAVSEGLIGQIKLSPRLSVEKPLGKLLGTKYVIFRKETKPTGEIGKVRTWDTAEKAHAWEPSQQQST